MRAWHRKPVLPVCLDLQNAWVWQGEQRLTLTPKAFAVLRYLIEHSGRIVANEELLQAVWVGTVVSDGALTTCMREIRKRLGEGAKAPQYIETVHRRGYRWMASLPPTPPPRRQATRHGHNRHAIRCVVGREAELAHLHRRLEQSRTGERQLAFVTGEAGIGKTTLVDAWLERVGTEAEIWSARGQCIEHYGSGEAYLPVLEALGRLCHAQRALPIYERKNGPDDQLVWVILTVLGGTLDRQGKVVDAEPLLRRSLAIVERRFGPDYAARTTPLKPSGARGC